MVPEFVLAQIKSDLLGQIECDLLAQIKCDLLAQIVYAEQSKLAPILVAEFR